MAFSKKEEEIIRWSLDNGKSPREIRSAIERFRLTGSPRETIEQAPVEQPGVSERVSDVLTERGQEIKSAITGEGEFSDQSALRRGVGAVATASSVPVSVATQVLPEPARKGLDFLKNYVGDQFKKLTDFIGSSPELQRFVQENPEATKVIEEIAGVGAGAGEIAGNVLLGQGAVSAVGKTAGAVGKANEALSGVTKVGTAGIQEATSKALNPASIMQRVARLSKGKQAKFEQLAGESVGEYLVKRGVFGDIDSITEQLFRRFQQSKKAADDAFAQLEGTFKTPAIGNALKQLLQKEEKISSPGALSKDLQRVRELSKKHTGSGLTMSEINEVKRLFERNVKLDFIRENLPEKVASANTLDSAIRTWQREKAIQLGFKNVKEINRETQLSKQLLDDLGKEYAGSAGNNAITLTDWVILAGGDPTAVGGFLAKKALSSRKVMSKIAEKLSPEATVGIPTAERVAPSVSGYLDFLKTIEGRGKPPTQPQQ